ncbi:MAG: GAF domain-containing protein [Rhodospirillaceae bacterium]
MAVDKTLQRAGKPMPGAARRERANGNVEAGRKPRAYDDRRIRETELLLEVNRRMAAYDSLDDVLAALVEMTTAELGTERGSLFLNDPETNELYSRVAQGNFRHEIRILNNSGIAGHVYTSGEPLVVHDAYEHPFFNAAVDEQTGYKTRNLMCVPIRTARGEIIGVAQTLNKKAGRFTKADLLLFQAMTQQGTLALKSAQYIERMKAVRQQEMHFINVVSEVTADIKLGSLLRRVMSEATKLLNAERSTLFLNDEKRGELWSEVGEGLDSMQIRLPNNVGIAGAVFTSGKSVNIPHAYADLRFNPAFDKKTGYFTRSILCVPIVNKQGRTIGVTQVLNKHGGPFTDEDESRLRAFTAQISIALENAKLFADVQNMQNYSEAMLESMSNGVVTTDEEHRVVTCNSAGLRILNVAPGDIINRKADDFFSGANAWVKERLTAVRDSQEPAQTMDAELTVNDGTVSVNLTALPLLSVEKKNIGAMLVIEDISTEKRLKSTMSRYMDPGIADQLVASGAEALGGRSVDATVLFSDIRGFTSITEKLGAQGTVSLLNEYFSLMVDAIQREEGMLDKFIGDAIMAVFGVPVQHADDADRAVRAAIGMIRALERWNRERIGRGMPTVHIGVGLNTDAVVAGNIGSRKRMDYTVIGDGVNLASRLESACKTYGTQILVSEFTYKALKATYTTREVDVVVVKGKSQPIAVYEVMDHHTDETYPGLIDALQRFREALTLYRKRRFADSAAAFRDVLAINPADKAAKLYVARCEYFGRAPPPDDWNSAWVMEEK